MITGEIKLYEEPASSWQVTTYTKQQTPAEREAWLTRCAAELDKAKQILQVGDEVFSNAGNKYNLRIVSFIEDVHKMQKYMDNPCVVEAHNIQFNNTNPIQYSLNELDLSTIRRKELPNV